MKIFKTISDWKNYRENVDCSIGFVPTLGGLHEGHLSLVRRSLKENKTTVVSLFLNPTQFNDAEDLKSYPSFLREDLEKLQALDEEIVVFCPEKKQMYPEKGSFFIKENPLSHILCGASRPGFFEGVMTVVLKLFLLVKPDRAYFGEKDYQQYIIVESMVKAFFLDIEIVLCEVIRDKEGLALSSRNRLLNSEEIKKARKLNKIISQRHLSAKDVSESLEREGFEVDFVEDHFNRRFVAVYLNKVRLIDNCSLSGPEKFLGK